MDVLPILALCMHLAGVIALLWFIRYWTALFSKRLEPLLHHRVSQKLGIEILRWERGSRYHWITPDKRPRSRALVFFWCAALFLGLGGVPIVLVLIAVGLILHAVNG